MGLVTSCANLCRQRTPPSLYPLLRKNPRHLIRSLAANLFTTQREGTSPTSKGQDCPFHSVMGRKSQRVSCFPQAVETGVLDLVQGQESELWDADDIGFVL